MKTSLSPFAISGITIRQQRGLYCLNDLHKASGYEPRHSPRRWTRQQQAQELVAELMNEKTTCPDLDTCRDSCRFLVTTNGIGTYACPELVVAYAAWISPAFHLKVLRLGITPQGVQVQQVPAGADVVDWRCCAADDVAASLPLAQLPALLGALSARLAPALQPAAAGRLPQLPLF